MNDLKIFSYEGKEVRTVEVDGDPWFVGKDVAEVLGYGKSRNALTTHVDAEDALKQGIPTNGGEQEMTIINESGLYSLILSSKMPTAKAFKRWVTSEILPSIRKHGGYLTPEKVEEALLNPDTLIKLATDLKTERAKSARLQEDIDKQAPMVLFAKSVSASDTTILIGELAKLLNGNGVKTGQNRLYEQLRQDGYLISRRGTDYNMPTQRSMELGLFKVKETAIAHSDGHVSVSKTTKVTGKGQQYFINRYMGA